MKGFKGLALPSLIFLSYLILTATGCQDLSSISGGQQKQQKTQQEQYTVGQVTSWVTDASFGDWVFKNPGMADEIAKFPYAANLFYSQPFFKEWSRRFPSKAQKVMNAAMQWESMSVGQQADFLRQNPFLRFPQAAVAQGGTGQQQQPPPYGYYGPHPSDRPYNNNQRGSRHFGPSQQPFYGNRFGNASGGHRNSRSDYYGGGQIGNSGGKYVQQPW